MDIVAVNQAKDVDLKELGLNKIGDIISLKAFASGHQSSSGPEERTEKKRKLLLDLCKTSGLKMGSRKKRKPLVSDLEFGEKPEPTRVVQCGWMQYQPSKGRYTVIRLARGGGTRNISIALSKTMNDILIIMKETFFPDGNNIFGNLSEMVLDIGNFKQDQMTHTDMTLAQYIDAHKLSKVRLYIMTKAIDQEANSGIESDDEQENDNDTEDELLQSVYTYTPLPDFDDIFSYTAAFKCDEPDNSSALVGTSCERDTLKREQDKEYDASLYIDQLKAQLKTRQQGLKDARALRVTEIPPVGEPHVTVSVRHVTMGLVTRSFSTNHTVSVVYDWVGSLSLTPEYFTLSTHTGVDLSPSVPISAIDKVMLYMTEREESPNYPEEDVNFLGYGTVSSLFDDTLSSPIAATTGRNSDDATIPSPNQPANPISQNSTLSYPIAATTGRNSDDATIPSPNQPAHHIGQNNTPSSPTTESNNPPLNISER